MVLIMHLASLVLGRVVALVWAGVDEAKILCSV